MSVNKLKFEQRLGNKDVHYILYPCDFVLHYCTCIAWFDRIAHKVFTLAVNMINHWIFYNFSTLESFGVSRRWIHHYEFLCKHYDFLKCKTRWCVYFKYTLISFWIKVHLSFARKNLSLQYHKFSLDLQWKMEKYLTSEEWDWTGSGCR